MLFTWCLFTVGLSALPLVRSEAFSSTAHLKLLSMAEGEMSYMLDKYLAQEESRLEKIRRMLPVLQQSGQRTMSSAGHPVNAYHLVKRWYLLSQLAANVGETPEDDIEDQQKENEDQEKHIKDEKDYNEDDAIPFTQKFQGFVNMHGLQMPTEADYIGSAAALLRLQRTYSLSTAELAKGKVFDEQSIEPLYAEDCFLLGDTAIKNNDYGLGAQWFDMATRVAQEETASPKAPNGFNTVEHTLLGPMVEFNLAETYLRLAQAQKTIGDLNAAVEAAKRAEAQDPNNSTIKAEMWSLVSQLESLNRDQVYVAKQNMTTWDRFLPDWKDKYEQLCRGDPVYRPPEVLKTLTCRYKKGRLIPWVQYKEETLSWDPRISMFYDVISDTSAELIKQQATPLLYRAVVGDPAKAYATNERVSKVAWLWDTEPDIKVLSDRVEDVTGLETEYRTELSSAEPFQVVNYGIGGQYEPHVDFYEDKVLLDSVPNFIMKTGDRITTFLFYLSDIKYGGATVFPQVGVRVPAIKNAAAFWYNAKPSGQFDGNTQHAGCPVLVGEKWVANKWIREYGQEFRRPCAVDQNAVWDV